MNTIRKRWELEEAGGEGAELQGGWQSYEAAMVRLDEAERLLEEAARRVDPHAPLTMAWRIDFQRRARQFLDDGNA